MLYSERRQGWAALLHAAGIKRAWLKLFDFGTVSSKGFAPNGDPVWIKICPDGMVSIRTKTDSSRQRGVVIALCRALAKESR